jgi:hypothetical protein
MLAAQFKSGMAKVSSTGNQLSISTQVALFSMAKWPYFHLTKTLVELIIIGFDDGFNFIE